MFTDEVSSLQPGMDLASATVSRFIGKGGLGEVYEVINEETGEVSAVKVMPRADAETDDPEFREILLESLEKISNPNLVPVLDHGDEDFFFWIRTAFVPVNEELRARSVWDLANRFRNRLGESSLRGVIAQTLRGISSLHEAGIAHGNLKPENLLLAQDGSVLVSDSAFVLTIGHSWDDFHLPRAEQLLSPTPFDPLPGFSRSLPSLLRSFDYFPPERESGQTAGDPLCDLYSAGLIAYHLLTGRSRPLLQTPPTDIVPGINPMWDAWIARATAYHREDRFPTATEMIQALPEATGEAEEPLESVPLRQQKVFYVPQPKKYTFDDEADPDPMQDLAASSDHGNSTRSLTLKREDSRPAASRSTDAPPGIQPASIPPQLSLGVPNLVSGPPPVVPVASEISRHLDPGEINIPDPRWPFFLKIAGVVSMLALAGYGAVTLAVSQRNQPSEEEPVSPVASTATTELPLLEGKVTLFAQRGQNYIVQVRPTAAPDQEHTIYVTEAFFRHLRLGQVVRVFRRDLAEDSPVPF